MDKLSAAQPCSRVGGRDPGTPSPGFHSMLAHVSLDNTNGRDPTYYAEGYGSSRAESLACLARLQLQFVAERASERRMNCGPRRHFSPRSSKPSRCDESSLEARLWRLRRRPSWNTPMTKGLLQPYKELELIFCKWSASAQLQQTFSVCTFEAGLCCSTDYCLN